MNCLRLCCLCDILAPASNGLIYIYIYIYLYVYIYNYIYQLGRNLFFKKMPFRKLVSKMMKNFGFAFGIYMYCLKKKSVKKDVKKLGL